MKLLDRILVATDFGLAAEDAVRMASWSACRFESKVDLLHVRPSGSTAGASSELDQAVSARLDAIAEHMVEQGVRQVESVVLDGTEFDAIVRYAEQQSVNVIVVGAGRRPREALTSSWARPPRGCGVGRRNPCGSSSRARRRPFAGFFARSICAGIGSGDEERDPFRPQIRRRIDDHDGRASVAGGLRRTAGRIRGYAARVCANRVSRSSTVSWPSSISTMSAPPS